jgi:hypothetical protein
MSHFYYFVSITFSTLLRSEESGSDFPQAFPQQTAATPELSMAMSPTSFPHPTPLATPYAAAKRRERLFFGGMAIALFVLVFAGFAPTYYLRSSFGSPELTPSLLIHGFAFTSWMVLVVVQTSLIAANKTALHRQLGVVGAVLGVVMMVIGAYVAITRTRAGLTAVVPGVSPLQFLVISMATLVTFPPLLGAAVWFRRIAGVHKRLVLIATLDLVMAAVGRLPGIFVPLGPIGPLGMLGLFGGTDLFLVAIAIYDWRTLGRLHPATLWGGLFLIASQVGRLLIGSTATWMSFAGWLTS